VRAPVLGGVAAAAVLAGAGAAAALIGGPDAAVPVLEPAAAAPARPPVPSPRDREPAPRAPAARPPDRAVLAPTGRPATASGRASSAGEAAGPGAGARPGGDGAGAGAAAAAIQERARAAVAELSVEPVDAARFATAAGALAGSLGPDGAPALREVASDAARPLAERVAAIELLRRLGQGPPALPEAALGALRQVVLSGSCGPGGAALASVAAPALGACGDAADRRALVGALEGTRGPGLDAAALRGLEAAPPTEVAPLLVDVLAAPPTARAAELGALALASAAARDPEVARALGRRAIAVLEPLAAAHPSPAVRERAAHALRAVAGGGDD